MHELSSCFQGRIKLYNFSSIDPCRMALNLPNNLVGESVQLHCQFDLSLLVGSRGGSSHVRETKIGISKNRFPGFSHC